jgi:Flp pilus assembly protein TadG
MKKLSDDRGQVTVIAALCMTCLLGFVAFAVDVGTLTHVKREMQTAADAGAVAGAAEFAYGGKTAATTAADAATALNGFTNGSNGISVAVNTPPSYGAYAEQPNYVEVIVSRSQPTFFMKMFSQGSKTVGARAVAYNGAKSSACVYVLDPNNDAQAMELQGSFDLSAPSCGIIVNSTSQDALDFTGDAGTLTAGYVGVVGDNSVTSYKTQSISTGVAAVSNPLAGVTPPDPTKLSCTTPSGNKLTGTVGPAVAGGTVCYNGNVTLSNVTLNQGTFVFTGNVTLNGTITSGTGGSTIDINSGSLSINTGTTLALVAPTTGTYNGIALMQPLGNSNQITIQKGDASGSLQGIIYAPSAKLYLQDSGGDKSGGLSLQTDLIVYKLFDKTATLSITSYTQTVPNSPLVSVALVE